MKTRYVRYTIGNKASYQAIFTEIRKVLAECLSLPEHHFLKLTVNQADCYYISICRNEKPEALFAAAQIRHNGVFLHVQKTEDKPGLYAGYGMLYNYLVKSTNAFRFTAPLSGRLRDELKAILRRSASDHSSANNPH